MVILGFKASKFDKKQKSLLLAHIMPIAHFLNLYGADMRLISCRWVTYIYRYISEGNFEKEHYSVKRSDLTWWKQGYITPPPPYFILWNAVTSLGDNKVIWVKPKIGVTLHEISVPRTWKVRIFIEI